MGGCPLQPKRAEAADCSRPTGGGYSRKAAAPFLPRFLSLTPLQRGGSKPRLLLPFAGLLLISAGARGR